jgi:RNA polymerase sigma-70 factor, ECF subfamily
MRHERRDHTLQPTALVHEVYLKLAAQRGDSWTGRAQFFAAASQAIRRILVNHAKARAADRRGGQYGRVSIEDTAGADVPSPDLLALDEALERLARLDPRQSRIVELRYFGGLSIDEVAELMGLSSRTVDGEWALARAWLRGEISRQTSRRTSQTEDE